MNVLTLHPKPWFSLVFITLWCQVSGEYQESIYWSPLNKIFHFTKNDFKNNRAFHSKFVTRQSNIIIICPNIATVLSERKDEQPADNLYENIWMVDEKGFHSCKIDTTIKENQLLHQCSQPGQLSFHNINFANVHYSKHANLSSIYLLATSNGSKGSLNNTSGGHCKNEEEGISLRIKFSVCDTSIPNNSCKERLKSSTNKSKGSLTCHNDTASTCTSRTTVESIHHWEVLAICLGVVLGLSLVINIISVLYLCVWRKRDQGPSKTKAEEPMKSLIVEQHKSKHGRVSAAL